MAQKPERREQAPGNDVFIDAFDEGERRSQEDAAREQETLSKRIARAGQDAVSTAQESMEGLLAYSKQLERIAENIEQHIDDAKIELDQYIANKRHRLPGRQFSHSVDIKAPRILGNLGNSGSAILDTGFAQMRGVQIKDLHATRGWAKLLQAVDKWNSESDKKFNAGTQRGRVHVFADLDVAQKGKRGDFTLELHFKQPPPENNPEVIGVITKA
jgi:hypothetical protein